jgi:hypothetical protein
VLAGNTTQQVTGAITGLSANTEYFYRVCAQSVAGYACGETLSFTTALAVVTNALPTVDVQTAINTQLQASGGSGSFSSWVLTSSSSLPAGLSLNTSSGVITGAASAAGSGSFTVQVTDSSGGIATGAISYSFTTPPPPPPSPAPPVSQPVTPTPVSNAPATVAPTISLSVFTQAPIVAIAGQSQSVTLLGNGLGSVSAQIPGVTAAPTVISSSSTSLVILLPANLAPGRYALVLQAGDQRIEIQDLVQVIAVPKPSLIARFTITNFAAGSAALTRPQILQLRKLVNEVGEAVSISCTGFTMGPKVISTDLLLAKTRARNTCNFLAREFGPLTRIYTAGKTELTLGGAVRRTEILVRYNQK